MLNCDLGLHGGFSWPTPPPVCIPVSQGMHTHWLSLAADGSLSLFKTRADTTPQLAWASPDPVLSMALSSEGATLLVAEGPWHRAAACPTIGPRWLRGERTA
ncbi:MAG: hypothetical protein IPH76_17515 [Xanthomonadales bacterium]|nr:hypothetical protein [Xanthomonadales bacterium]